MNFQTGRFKIITQKQIQLNLTKNPKPEEAHNRSLKLCAFLLLALHCLEISFHVLPLKSELLAQQDQPVDILSILKCQICNLFPPKVFGLILLSK
jgi:hypothetical protein